MRKQELYSYSWVLRERLESISFEYQLFSGALLGYLLRDGIKLY
jgi:hypothetical protein